VENHADPDHEEGLTEGHEGLPRVSLLYAHVINDFREHELLLLNSKLYLLVRIWRSLCKVTIISMVFISLEIDSASINILLLLFLS
jgi:hypothetical protein